MTSTTSAGTKFKISAGLPATQDVSGYKALTYTTVKGVQSIPAFGPTTAVNNFQPLDGPEEKHKGPTSYGSLQMPMAYDKADAGQTLVRTAAAVGNNAIYSGSVELTDGSTAYFPCRVFGSPIEVGSATNVLMMNPTVEVTGLVIIDPGT